ncbi:MAG: choice-of-anchor tandem repeat GloVer-containing protein [Rhodospirillales bacterium]
MVLDSEGNLHATTNLGGENGEGVMFELSPTGGDQAGWTETVLYSFTGYPDGEQPVGNLISESDGVLLVSASGGTTGFGAIVQLKPPTVGEVWREKVIYSFPSGGIGGTTQ